MRTKIIVILSVWCAVLLLAACDVKDPLFNTSHPDYEIVTLTVQWSGIGEGLGVPESYTIKAGNYTATLTGVTNKLDYLFEPGDYRFYVYNTPERITMNNTVASVIAPAVIPTDAGSTTSDNPERFVYDAPGWLFTSVLDATLTADTEHILAAPMQQQVRQLTLIIEPTGGMADKIESITATLSGVAGTLDIANGTHGAPSRVALTFSKILFGTDAGKWSALRYRRDTTTVDRNRHLCERHSGTSHLRQRSHHTTCRIQRRQVQTLHTGWFCSGNPYGSRLRHNDYQLDSRQQRFYHGRLTKLKQISNN